MNLNLPTILVGLVVLFAVGTAALKMLRDRKHGRACCGSACAGCPHAGQCRKN